MRRLRQSISRVVGVKEVTEAVKERFGEELGEYEDRGRFGQKVRAMGIMFEDGVMDEVYDRIRSGKNKGADLTLNTENRKFFPLSSSRNHLLNQLKPEISNPKSSGKSVDTKRKTKWIELQELREVVNRDSQLLAEVRGRVQEIDEDRKGMARLKDISEAIMGCYAELLSGYSLEKALSNFKTHSDHTLISYLDLFDYLSEDKNNTSDQTSLNFSTLSGPIYHNRPVNPLSVTILPSSRNQCKP